MPPNIIQLRKEKKQLCGIEPWSTESDDSSESAHCPPILQTVGPFIKETLKKNSRNYVKPLSVSKQSCIYASNSSLTATKKLSSNHIESHAKIFIPLKKRTSAINQKLITFDELDAIRITLPYKESKISICTGRNSKASKLTSCIQNFYKSCSNPALIFSQTKFSPISSGANMMQGIWKQSNKRMDITIKLLGEHYSINQHFIVSLLNRYYNIQSDSISFLASASLDEIFNYALYSLKSRAIIEKYFNQYLSKKSDDQRAIIYKSIYTSNGANFTDFIELNLIVKYKNPSHKLAIQFILRIFEINLKTCKCELLQRIKYFHLLPLSTHSIKTLAYINGELSECFNSHSKYINKDKLHERLTNNTYLCRMILNTILY